MEESSDDLIQKILVTKPIKPNIQEFSHYVQQIIESNWFTNFGKFHNLLQARLKSVLGVDNLSLVNNGTSALIVGIKSLELPEKSEVITTPFTFAATCHSIIWNNLVPVFCDIEPNTFTIDVNKIESLINKNTSAILGVHVYGYPCNVTKIKEIADKYGLKVIYDAAHSFGSVLNGKSIGCYGDIVAYSFHATKLFNTIEGGAIVSNNQNNLSKIHSLINFGIVDQDNVNSVGINAKLNEVCAAWGLSNLESYKEEYEKRKKVYSIYYDSLKNLRNVYVPDFPPNCSNSFQYFPVLLKNAESRELVLHELSIHNIYARKYFSPICSDFLPYNSIKGREFLKVSNDYKNRILCLPFYGDIPEHSLNNIIHTISKFSL